MCDNSWFQQPLAILNSPVSSASIPTSFTPVLPNLRHGSSTFHQTSAETEPWLHHRPVLAPWPSLSGSCTLPRFPWLSGSRTLRCFPSSYVSEWIRQGGGSLFQTRKLWLKKARWRGIPWSQKWFCVETSPSLLTSLFPRYVKTLKIHVSHRNDYRRHY